MMIKAKDIEKNKIVFHLQGHLVVEENDKFIVYYYVGEDCNNTIRAVKKNDIIVEDMDGTICYYKETASFIYEHDLIKYLKNIAFVL